MNTTYGKLAIKTRRAVRAIARVRKALEDVHPQSPEGMVLVQRAAQAAAVVDRATGGPRRRTQLLARLRREKVTPSVPNVIDGVDLCEKCFGSIKDSGGAVTTWSGMKSGSVIERVVCEDCDFRARVDEFEAKGELTRWLVQECSMIGWWLENRSQGYRLSFRRRALRFAKVARAVNAAVDRIHDAVKRFERDAWFGGLQAFVADEKASRGHSGRLQGVKFLSYVIAGRWMGTITDEKTGDNVTVITADDSDKPIMGMQSVAATADSAIRLLDLARERWREFQLVPDDEVSVA